jgi:hypothetical protein
LGGKRGNLCRGKEGKEVKDRSSSASLSPVVFQEEMCCCSVVIQF